jgi:hypothetical protein
MLVIAAVLLAAQTAAPTPDPCLRKAFGDFCLGGPTALLPANPQTTDGGATLAWSSGDEVTMAKPFDGQVAVVARTYKPQTALKFNELAQQLRGVFGEPKDEGQFPDYADTESARATAIELGKAKALLTWSRPGWRYTVQLLWQQKSLMVVYRADELEARRKAGAKPKF